MTAPAAANFNRTFELSSAPLFKWAAHDDLHRSNYLESCIRLLEDDPAAVLAHSGTAFIGEDGQPFPFDTAIRYRHRNVRQSEEGNSGLNSWNAVVIPSDEVTGTLPVDQCGAFIVSTSQNISAGQGIDMDLRVDDWVEIRGKDEILATLDMNGRLDGLPFMPQMFKYCGQRFRIFRSAHKTCDTVSGHYAGRRLEDGVHLNLRCDGQAYNGCQAGCLMFWKTAWLKPADGPVQIQYVPKGAQPQREGAPSQISCTEDDILRARTHQDAAGNIIYSCQATELLIFTKPLKWWDPRQYVESYTSGNRTLPELVRGISYLLYYYGTLAFSDRWGRPARWLYNRVQAITGGVPFPRLKGAAARSRSSARGHRAGEILRGDPCHAGHEPFEQRPQVRRRARPILRQGLSRQHFRRPLRRRKQRSVQADEDAGRHLGRRQLQSALQRSADVLSARDPFVVA